MIITPQELNQQGNDWKEVANNIAVELGFSLIETKSFEHILQLFFADEDVPSRTEMYIKEDKLEDHLIDIIAQFSLEYDEETVIYEKFLQYVTNLYHYEIEDWTYKEERISVRISTNLRSKLNDIDGDSLPQKLNNLVLFFNENR